MGAADNGIDIAPAGHFRHMLNGINQSGMAAAKNQHKPFSGLQHQRLLLEYDTERAGSFEPLRFVPKGKIAVLGLITTKVGRVESVDELRRRVDEAAHYLPLEQLAISPQCGFASSLRGNLLSEDEQFRKLEVMLEVARKVWN